VVVTSVEEPAVTLATPASTPASAMSTPTPMPTRQVQPGSAPTATPQPKPAQAAPLAVNYIIESAGPDPADPNQWSADVLITASGGDGNYTYYHDGLPLTNPRVTVVYRACRNKPGSFWVDDGTGARAALDYFLYAPYCNKTPVP